MLRFEHPAVLLLLFLLPLLKRRKQSPLAVPQPALLGFDKQSQGFRERCLQWMPVLRTSAFVFLIVALAGPLLRPSKIPDVTNGLAIELVLDRSLSMAAQDMGAGESRIDAVKRLSRDFIFGAANDGLGGRPNDKVGIIEFAAYPITLSPLTLSHDLLHHSLDEIRLAETIDEDGTAIGDALALAAARLHTSVKNPATGEIIILITDGENNLGARSPEEAARLARDWGVKIYAILLQPVDLWNDPKVEATMSYLTQMTHGSTRVIKDREALRDVYNEIDRIEPAHLESVKLDDGGRAITWSLAAGLCFLLVEFTLRETWLRKAPA